MCFRIQTMSFWGQEYADRITIKPNLKTELIFRFLVIMKTIPYNDKLIDFFRRNTGSKLSILKAWKRGEESDY